MSRSGTLTYCTATKCSHASHTKYIHSDLNNTIQLYRYDTMKCCNHCMMRSSQRALHDDCF